MSKEEKNIQKLQPNQVVEFSLRFLLGLVFVLFGLAKFGTLEEFVQIVANFQIAPFNTAPWDMWLAYSLPGAEVLAGLCLLCGIFYRGALVLIAGMTTAFIYAIASVWSRGLDVECGCAGDLVSFGGYGSHIAILAVMLMVTAWLIARCSVASADLKE